TGCGADGAADNRAERPSRSFARSRALLGATDGSLCVRGHWQAREDEGGYWKEFNLHDLSPSDFDHPAERYAAKCDGADTKCGRTPNAGPKHISVPRPNHPGNPAWEALDLAALSVSRIAFTRGPRLPGPASDPTRSSGQAVTAVTCRAG